MMREPLAQLLDRTFSAAEREVIYRLMRGFGQVRRFAADPIPTETLQRILEATLETPFLGEMPPWHFILVTSPGLRAAIMAAVEDGCRPEASMRPDDRGHTLSGGLTHKRLAEAPLHLAITYDRSGSGPGQMNQALEPAMDIYQMCWAIQLLWLAACAEGIGVVRIPLADEGAVARLLGLPPGVQLIAYLGLGFPRAFRVRPRRQTVDRRIQTHLVPHIYTDIWGGGPDT